MKIGFLADIHEDIESLQTAIKLLDNKKCDSIICLGDIVGFHILFQKHIKHRNANECLKLIKENCDAVVAGNHDLYAVKRIPLNSPCFNYPVNWYSLSYEEKAKLSKNKIWLYEDSELPNYLSDKSIEYLRSLPEYAVIYLGGINFLFSHFNYPDLTGSTIYFPNKGKDLKKHFMFMNDNGCSISISGHGHIEGFAIGKDTRLNFYSFGSYQLGSDLQWLVCPCVANTTRANGVMIFDTNTFQLDVIALGSPKIIV